MIDLADYINDQYEINVHKNIFINDCTYNDIYNLIKSNNYSRDDSDDNINNNSNIKSYEGKNNNIDKFNNGNINQYDKELLNNVYNYPMDSLLINYQNIKYSFNSNKMQSHISEKYIKSGSFDSIISYPTLLNKDNEIDLKIHKIETLNSEFGVDRDLGMRSSYKIQFEFLGKSKFVIYGYDDFKKCLKTNPEYDFTLCLGKSCYLTKSETNYGVYLDLPNNDFSISNKHAKICVKEGFMETKSCGIAIFHLLKALHSKNYARYPIRSCIPKEVIRIICAFIKEPPHFMIQDSGSITGTYINLPFKQNKILCQDDEILIGDMCFYIEKICYPKSNRIPNEDDFLYLVKEYNDNTGIYGLTDEEIEILLNTRDDYNFGLIKENHKNNDANKICDLPWPLIKFSAYRKYYDIQSIIPESKIIVIPNAIQTFIIGRSIYADIGIDNDVNISREHATLTYNHKGWSISDGSNIKKSLNGTWISINNTLKRMGKSISKPFPLKDGDLIKISSNILKFSLLKDNQKQQFLI